MEEAMIIFAAILACVGFLLLIHHGLHHSRDRDDSNAKKESCVCVCYFQPKDISHFETWIIVCFTNAICIAMEIPFIPLMPLGVVITLVILCFVGCGLGCMLTYQCYDLEFHDLRKELMHNISNHETWIIVCLSNSITLLSLSLSVR